MDEWLMTYISANRAFYVQAPKYGPSENLGLGADDVVPPGWPGGPRRYAHQLQSQRAIDHHAPQVETSPYLGFAEFGCEFGFLVFHRQIEISRE